MVVNNQCQFLGSYTFWLRTNISSYMHSPSSVSKCVYLILKMEQSCTSETSVSQPKLYRVTTKNLINTANIIDAFLQHFLGNMSKLFSQPLIFMTLYSNCVTPGKLQNIAGVDGSATASNQFVNCSDVLVAQVQKSIPNTLGRIYTQCKM